MEAIEQLLMTSMEELQYTIFFGALFLFGLLELAWSRGNKSDKRLSRWPSNFGLTAINIIALGAIPVSGLWVAIQASKDHFGLLNQLALPGAGVIIIGLLLRSLISWLVHFLMHKVPLLWRLHKVHHADTELDISTTVRFHPLELLVSTPIALAAIYFLGLSPLTVLVYELFDTFMAVFTHANVRIPRQLDRILKTVFVTPDMHRVHHSNYQPETDSNYGATLSLWDHLFRTYKSKTSLELKTMELGLTQYKGKETRNLLWLISLPFRTYTRSSEPPTLSEKADHLDQHE